MKPRPSILLSQLEAAKDRGFRRNFDLTDAALTNIAMTLQRMNDDLRGNSLGFAYRVSSAKRTETIENRVEEVIEKLLTMQNSER